MSVTDVVIFGAYELTHSLFEHGTEALKEDQQQNHMLS